MLYLPGKIRRGSFGEIRSQGRCHDIFVIHPSDCVLLHVSVETCCIIKVKKACHVCYNSD